MKRKPITSKNYVTLPIVIKSEVIALDKLGIYIPYESIIHLCYKRQAREKLAGEVNRICQSQNPRAM